MGWNCLLFAYMVTVCLFNVTSAENIVQRINYGVVFRQESRLHLATESWLHTFKVTLPKKVNVPSQSFCSVDSKSCMFTNNMLHFVQHLQRSMEYDLSQTIMSISTLVPQTKIFDIERKQRSLLPFIGTLAKGLFGLATMSDVRLLANHINALNRRTQQIGHALQQHGDHLSSFMEVVDNRTTNLMHGIQENSKQIIGLTKSFESSLRTLEQNMMNMSKVLTTLSNNFNVLRSNLLQLQSSVQSLVEGKISPSLIPKIVLTKTLHKIQSTLTKYYPGFHLTHFHPTYYYTTSNFMFTRNHSSLYITVKFPVSSHSHPLQLYKILTFPVPANNSMNHATQLLDLPNYIAFTHQHDYYLPLKSSDLTNCVHGENTYCNYNMALTPTSNVQCSLALFQNDVNQVSKLCNFRFLENHVSHNIVELTPTSALVYHSEDIHIECPDSKKRIPGCIFCIVEIPCKCSLRTQNLYFSPRLVDCYNASRSIKVLHPVNLALVREFFDEKHFDHILADTLFPSPVQVSLPKFSFYSHKMSSILAADAKTHLSLKKMAKAAKRDALIFKTLAEPLLSGDINLSDTWPDVNAILSFCSLGVACLSLFAFLFLFCKTRKMATAMLVMQQMSNVRSQTVPSFIYHKVTEAPKADDVNISDRIKNFIISEFTWVHASVILSIFVLIFLCTLLCYLYKSRSKRCSTLVLEITSGGNCAMIPILDLSLCPSYFDMSKPAVKDLSIAAFPSCKLFVVWSHFDVTNKLTNQCVKIPTTLSLSFINHFKLSSILKQPFNAYVYVTHQGFASLLTPDTSAITPKQEDANQITLYPQLT